MSATTTPSDSGRSFLGEQPGAERIYDNVQNVCAGSALPAIKMALWNTIEEYAIKSTAWRQTLVWTLAAGNSSICFNPIDADTLVAAVMQVSGLAHYLVDPPATLIDKDPPISARTGEVIVSTKPASFTSNMPDDLYSNRFEAILDGTLSRMFTQPAKPWTSVQLASYHGRRYRSAIIAAHAAANGAHSGQAGWRFPAFASGRRGR
jgi:hypothetical protein